MYFAKGVSEGFTGLMATHPPLPKRILAIDPSWDGVFPRISASSTAAIPSPQVGVGFAGHPPAAVEEIPVAAVRQAADRVGAPEQVHREYATHLLNEIDPLLVTAAHEPYSARALVFALLLDRDVDIRKRQIHAIREAVEDHLVVETIKLAKLTDQLGGRVRLPLMDMTLPALRSMSPPQYLAFMRAFAALADADNRYSIFEWTLAQVLIRHLKPQFVAVGSPITLYYSLNGLIQPVSILLSTMAQVGHEGDWVQASFAAGRGELKDLPVELLPRSACTLKALDKSLKTLARATATLRGRLVDATAVAICVDNRVTVAEAELLRGIADLLDCPVPPWVWK